MPVLHPHPIEKDSPFLGEECALCKQPFGPGEDIVICPEDAARHHVHCWLSNDNQCTAFGCTGRGPVYERPGRSMPPVVNTSTVRTLPDSSFSLAQSCLLLAIALAIIIIAFSCFGLWAILDYWAIEVQGWQYRPPLTGQIWPTLSVSPTLLWVRQRRPLT